LDVLYAPEVRPDDAGEPLGLVVKESDFPLHNFFSYDPQLRSARAFRSGAVLATGVTVCGRTFVGYYVDLSLGLWSPGPPIVLLR
jgi:hypothetical protein